jgi:hypothetical protein
MNRFQMLDAEQEDQELVQPSEESSISDEEAKKMAIEKLRSHYGLDDSYPGARMAASALAKKQGTPMDLQLQQESGIKQAGEIGMDAGMAMGSLGKFSQVQRGLAKELQAAKQASNLSALGAKAGDTSKIINQSPKMTPEQLKLMAKKLGL